MTLIHNHTSDGSSTLFSTKFKENYHSTQGAVLEAKHVFIEAGLQFKKKKNISVFEVGFGTGLNALLSILYAIENNIELYYESIEAYPIQEADWQTLNYTKYLNCNPEYLNYLHKAEWNICNEFSPCITIKKVWCDLQKYNTDNKFDLIYFDAFSPESQKELWSINIFDNLYKILNPGGVLVTYSSKGSVKNTLRTANFVIERLKGAGNKRHMLRALKTIG